MNRSLLLAAGFSSFAFLAVGTSGCALLMKDDPIVPRYYTPEVPETTAAKVAAPPAASDLSVRIGRVAGGSYLKERIAHRDSDHEFGFYEDRRWTERPEAYLQRALEHSLFEERGLTRALAVTAPTLTVDLVEFEEVRGNTPHVRLRVSYALHDERTVYLERSLSVEHALAAGTEADRTDRVAASLGDALREAVSRVADDVIAGLRANRAHPPT